MIMENLFTTLTNKLPKPSEDQQKQLEQLQGGQKLPQINDKTPVKDVVIAWQKDPNEQNTALVLKKMQPTIASAMNSYAPGADNRLGIKAANITLKTLKSYDPSYGTEPSTYVFHALKRLARYNAANEYMIPRSESAQLERNRVKAVYDSFVDNYEREPSVAELADKTGFSMKKIQQLMSGGAEISESSTLTEDSRRDTVGSSDLTDDDYFEYVYSSVGPMDQKIMDWTSGKHGKKQLSNNDIARRLKVSPAAVSQRKGRIQAMLAEIREVL